MNSPVFLSQPTTSGSPPELSISESDQSFAALTDNLDSTSAQAVPLCRSTFFSKRAFKVRSNSSSCFADNSFLFRPTLFILLIDLGRSFCSGSLVSQINFCQYRAE